MKKACLFAIIAVLAIGSFVVAGETGGFSFTYAPARGAYIPFDFNVYSLGKYLDQCQVNRPEILNEVKLLLGKGEFYRKRTQDQKGKGTLLTVHVDTSYTLHIVTYRNEDCPSCGGTGSKKLPLEKVSRHVGFNIGCTECRGKGILENQTTEKLFTLSSEDFEDPALGRRIIGERAFANAPTGAEEWVERLVSRDPRARLEACIWLDKNYIREGMFFQDVMPMLKKARFQDTNNKKRLMVWQFWAGKDLPNERKRAYYRIYADTKTGKITQKGFYSGN